jgi:hypothetical protein
MLVVSILPVKYLKFKIIKLVIILLFYLNDLNDGLELLVFFLLLPFTIIFKKLIA